MNEAPRVPAGIGRRPALLGLATAVLAAAVVVGGIGMLAGFDELRRTLARLPYGVIGFNTLVSLVSPSSLRGGADRARRG